MLSRLWHSSVSSRHDKNTTVHSGSSSNHVFDIIGVTRAVNMAVMSLISLILDCCSINGDTTGFFFGSTINVSVVLELSLAFISKMLCDSGRQSCFTVINVTNCSNI